MVKQHVGRPRRAHPEERADDAGRGHRRFQHVGLEPPIEKVDGAHGHELHEVVLVLTRQRAEALDQKQQLSQIARMKRQRIRRQHGKDRLDEPAHLHHPAPVLVIGFGVDARVPRDLPAGLAVIVDAPQVIAVGHRRERAVERQNLEPVSRKVELADDFRSEQRDDVRADGKLEALEDFFGDGRAAEHVTALEHEHFAPGACQVGGGGQAIVPAADDDRRRTRRAILTAADAVAIRA